MTVLEQIKRASHFVIDAIWQLVEMDKKHESTCMHAMCIYVLRSQKERSSMSKGYNMFLVSTLRDEMKQFSSCEQSSLELCWLWNDSPSIV